MTAPTSGSAGLPPSVKDLDLAGKRVLVRVDYNVPQDEQGQITDDSACPPDEPRSASA